MRPRTAAALFPYTTLFRSSDSLLEVLVGALHDHRVQADARHHGEMITGHIVKGDLDQVDRLGHSVECDIERDRKSTRLNSSHLVISYAVFCSKKKNAAQTT